MTLVRGRGISLKVDITCLEISPRVFRTKRIPSWIALEKQNKKIVQFHAAVYTRICLDIWHTKLKIILYINWADRCSANSLSPVSIRVLSFSHLSETPFHKTEGMQNSEQSQNGKRSRLNARLCHKCTKICLCMCWFSRRSWLLALARL